MMYRKMDLRPCFSWIPRIFLRWWRRCLKSQGFAVVIFNIQCHSPVAALITVVSLGMGPKNGAADKKETHFHVCSLSRAPLAVKWATPVPKHSDSWFIAFKRSLFIPLYLELMDCQAGHGFRKSQDLGLRLHLQIAWFCSELYHCKSWVAVRN